MTRDVNTDDCWLYALYINKHGYGAIGYRVSGEWKTYGAHRFMYEGLVGEIPYGLEIDHLCRIRSCINPDHLEPVTKQENMNRRFNLGLCKNGHKLNPENTYIGVKDRRTGRVGRQCSICKKEYSRIRWATQNARKELDMTARARNTTGQFIKIEV